VFWKRRAEVENAPKPACPKRRFTDEVGAAASVVGKGISLKGEITGSDSLEIAGFVDGNVTVRGYCLVHENGRVQGRISAHHVIVEGRVDGKIAARKRTELRSRAHVCADVKAESVAMAEGAFFDGRIQMREGGSQTSFQEKRRCRNDA
jgi:cytoskeletal protein CcmA (bactofilin family)